MKKHPTDDFVIDTLIQFSSFKTENFLFGLEEKRGGGSIVILAVKQQAKQF